MTSGKLQCSVLMKLGCILLINATKDLKLIKDFMHFKVRISRLSKLF